MQNIIEYLRQEAVSNLLRPKIHSYFTGEWHKGIAKIITPRNPSSILNLGDHLSEIFQSTRTPGRTQGELSSGGTAWEALVCWYLNLCLIGRRTVVIKQNKFCLPTPVADALTVNYGNFPSNTESDLIAITFPDKHDYNIDKQEIKVLDIKGDFIPVRGYRQYPFSSRKIPAYNLIPILNALTSRDFGNLEIHDIQCKTNWNDNAQIPMLWDAVYASRAFSNGISIGRNGFSIHDCSRFSYSFVTVPTNHNVEYNFKSTPVLRVRNLSGGNYWGYPSRQGVASSIKEMLDRNLRNGHQDSILATIDRAIPELSTTYSYFQI